jgi:signal transduction histidine kinase
VKPFRLRSVTVQLIILFVAVLSVLQIADLGYRYVDRSQALASLEAIRIADNIAVLASIIEKTPPSERAAVTAYFRGSSLYASWLGEHRPNTEPASDNEAELLHEALLKILPPSADSDVVVGYAASDQQGELVSAWRRVAGSFPEPVSDIIEELASEPTFQVSVRLNDGTWLTVTAAYVQNIDFWPLKSVALLSIFVIGIGAMSIWAIQRLTAPFRVFAAAAGRLGTDVNAMPLEEHGPSEARSAIRAFNDMQRRLQRFIADRTQMLAAVSHDLRTPITRLRLRAECINDSAQSAKLLADLKHMEEMIDSVLNFAKDDALSEPTVSVDLIAMLQSICDELTDRGFDLTFSPRGRLPYNCRRVSIRRCFGNIIENAVKYGQQAEVRLESGADEIMIRVEDRGPGIPENFREEVFRPFFRLEGSRSRNSGGSGLGLTVARTVARAHGGDVRLSAASGGGLVATVVLPRQSGATLAKPLAIAAE